MTGTDALDFDFIVLGGGMAGCSAAGYAASRGASVCLVEKAADIGGSAILSGGWVWTAPTYEIMRERAPEGDAHLQKVFLERWPKAAEWIRSTGVSMSEERVPPVPYGRGFILDILAYVRRCAALVESAHGYVLRSTTTESLIVEDGKVRGVVVRTAGETATLRAPAVILATGGFQGNSSLLYEQFGENSRQMLLRSNAHSTGDGLRLGLQAGADVAGDMSTFYGHVVAWPLMEFEPRDFQRFSLSPYSLQGLLVNLSCERFTDESFGHQGNAIAVAKQAHARAAALVDDARRTQVTKALGTDKLDDARRAGARVATVSDVDGIARTLESWGFDPTNLRGTIDAYNAMIGGGPRSGMPPRKWNRNPFGPGPYHVFEVRPGITTTQGGLRIDDRSRVLDRDGRPIPGLFAAGGDTGGFYNGGYAGNLCVCSVFGITAVETVLGAKLFSQTELATA